MRQEQGRILIAIARDAIAKRLGLPGKATAVDGTWLEQPRATFVTLTRNGTLRGCIGSLEAYRPLREDVQHNAIAAAFHDPRFPPLSPAEWNSLNIEVSVLSEPRPLPASSEEEAIAQLVPQRDGVILSWRNHRATFLPQVWRQLPDPRLFLAQLKRKAGLSEGFWHPALKLMVYQVEHFQEPAS